MIPRKSVSELTLRDYFAAAVAGQVWAEIDPDVDSGTCAIATAQKAYMVADAMLAERERPTYPKQAT